MIATDVKPDVNLLDAIRLLGIYTAQTFDIWSLAGSPKAGCRAHVMSALVGKRMPQSKSGVTMLRDAFYEQVKPGGGCLANREDAFIAFCRDVYARYMEKAPDGRVVVRAEPAAASAATQFVMFAV